MDQSSRVPASNRLGRPSKLTPELQDSIVKAIQAGNYAQVAARHAGIGETTFYRWLQQGQADAEANRKTSFRDFWEAVKKAESAAEVRAVVILQRAMPNSWQAAMTYLERRYPARWGRRERFEHSGPQGRPIEVVDAKKILLEKLRRLAACNDHSKGD